VRNAIDAALFRGELEPLWQNFLQRVAAQHKVDDEELALDDGAIERAAEQFRYDHDLITAEETEQWLACRGLSLDEFSEYFLRRAAVEAADEDLALEEIDYLAASDDLRQMFAGELILSGELDWLANALSWRLAIAAATASDQVDPAQIDAEREEFFERTGLKNDDVPEWLEKLGRDNDWFEQMLRMESEYQRRCASLLTPHARQRELISLRLPLTRFETEVIELESRDAAQEALFCVREDGMSMEEVAVEGRYPYKTLSFLQEDIPEDLQPKFLSVHAGDVLEPLTRGDAFELYRITSKVEPQADDPALHERVDQILLNRHFSELTSRYIEMRLHHAAATEE
jgi:hypothetical protein